MARARRDREDEAPVEPAEQHDPERASFDPAVELAQEQVAQEQVKEHIVGEDDTAVTTRTFVTTFDDSDGMHEEYVTIPADAPAPVKGELFFDPEAEEDDAATGRLVHRVEELDLAPAVDEDTEDTDETDDEVT